MDATEAIRASAKFGLQVVVLASRYSGQDVLICFDQVIEVADLRDTGDFRYRGALVKWTPMIISVFERLIDQIVVTGSIDKGNQRLLARVTTDVFARLHQAAAGNTPRIDTIRTALAAAKRQAPDAPGPFVDLAREIGFEP